jgi:hypothetical protein
MGFTRYWERTDKALTEEFVEMVKTIIAEAETKGIHICGGDGGGEPLITTDQVCFNGDGTIGADHETCYFATGEEPGFNFCKTAEKPYDYAVKRVLKVAEEMGIVENVRSDGECEEMADSDWVAYEEEMRKKYPWYR